MESEAQRKISFFVVRSPHRTPIVQHHATTHTHGSTRSLLQADDDMFASMVVESLVSSLPNCAAVKLETGAACLEACSEDNLRKTPCDVVRRCRRASAAFATAVAGDGLLPCPIFPCQRADVERLPTYLLPSCCWIGSSAT